MKPNRLVTLLSDFGYEDIYAGAMKGAVLEVDPGIRIVDITHGIPPQDVFAGALALRGYAGIFPAGTVHLAVIDPGVGGERKPIVAATESHFYVGPDNGLFTFITDGEPQVRVYEVADTSVFREPVSAVFHGRDIFGPVAGHLATGRDPASFGPPVEDCVRLNVPKAVVEEDSIEGQVISSDRFGNLITNIPNDVLTRFAVGRTVRVDLAGRWILGLSETYSQQREGILLALVGSSGMLEIAVNRGSALEALDASVGTSVWVSISQAER